VLAGCATFGDKVPQPAPIAPTQIPAVPAELDQCADRKLASIPEDRDLTGEEIERGWKTDRAGFLIVRSCLRRALCQAHDIRAKIGRVEDEPTCAPPRNPKPAVKKGGT
jgi:hypothetical protein